MNIVDLAVRVIKEEFEKRGLRIDKIILFGSRARGDFKEDSDWDFLVVVDKNLSFHEKWDIIDEIKKKLAKDFIPNDIIIKSSQEIEEEREDVGKITHEILREGILL